MVDTPPPLKFLLSLILLIYMVGQGIQNLDVIPRLSSFEKKDEDVVTRRPFTLSDLNLWVPFRLQSNNIVWLSGPWRTYTDIQWVRERNKLLGETLTVCRTLRPLIVSFSLHFPREPVSDGIRFRFCFVHSIVFVLYTLFPFSSSIYSFIRHSTLCVLFLLFCLPDRLS